MRRRRARRFYASWRPPQVVCVAGRLAEKVYWVRRPRGNKYCGEGWLQFFNPRGDPMKLKTLMAAAVAAAFAIPLAALAADDKASGSAQDKPSSSAQDKAPG